MNIRPETLGAAALVIIVGLAIGAWLASVARSGAQQTATVTVANASRTPRPAATVASSATATPTASGPATPAATVAATATTTAIVRPQPTHLAPTVAPGDDRSGGSWRLDEANVQVGPMVWVSDTVLSRGNTLIVEAHKHTVNGRPATLCERRTHLHTEISLSTADQTAAYREVNCTGLVSNGEVRVRSVSASEDAFSGSFWRNGVKLGDFSARRTR